MTDAYPLRWTDPPIVYKIEVERRPANAPSDDDVIHPIIWDSRGKRR